MSMFSTSGRRMQVLPRVGAGGATVITLSYAAEVVCVVEDDEVVIIQGTKKLRVGDRSVPAQLHIQDAAGNPFDFTGWTNPRFTMRDSGEAAEIEDAAATIADAANGDLEYAWGAGETDTPGTHLFLFTIEDPSGLDRTFPPEGWARLTIGAK